MDQTFKAIERQDTVVSIPEEYLVVMPRSMFRIEEFAQKAKALVSNGKHIHAWMQSGIPCEILEPEKTWKKGRIRLKVSLEFCSDEVELLKAEENQASDQSTLDDIRQAIAEDN